MTSESQESAAPEAPATPAQDPRLQLWLWLGERQYLMTKLAAEMTEITRKLDELNKKTEPTS